MKDARHNLYHLEGKKSVRVTIVKGKRGIIKYKFFDREGKATLVEVRRKMASYNPKTNEYRELVRTPGRVEKEFVQVFSTSLPVRGFFQPMRGGIFAAHRTERLFILRWEKYTGEKWIVTERRISGKGVAKMSLLSESGRKAIVGWYPGKGKTGWPGVGEVRFSGRWRVTDCTKPGGWWGSGYKDSPYNRYNSSRYGRRDGK